jgi:hypothetical protein
LFFILFFLWSWGTVLLLFTTEASAQPPYLEFFTRFSERGKTMVPNIFLPHRALYPTETTPCWSLINPGSHVYHFLLHPLAQPCNIFISLWEQIWWIVFILCYYEAKFAKGWVLFLTNIK